MKMKTSIRRAPTCLLAVVLLATGAATTAKAQTALQGQLVLRPVTPGDVSNYKLPAGTETSAGVGPGGIATLGVGTPAYLEADINLGVPASSIVSVTWKLTATPPGSTATLQPSPLGTNVPVFEPADRLVYQVADRRLLRPDLTGQYTVVATVISTNDTNTLSLTMTAAKYMGVNTCALCHSGGQIAIDQYDPWSHTPHASKFSRSIDGLVGFYSQSCISCHTVGYDSNTNVTDNGFFQLAQQLGWHFPAVLTNGNWASMQTNYPSLANLANIQCENCHGPGSEHAYALGDVNKISINFSSGNCGQCHDAPSHHIKNAEWNNSRHAVTTRDPSGPGREACVGCHTTPGFIGEADPNAPAMTNYVAINCIACHDAHDASIPHQLRAWNPPTLKDGTVVTNAGTGGLCMQCHHARQNAAVYAATAKGSTYFGPHEGPQADMIEGVNGFTYGQAIPSSAHRTAVTNVCVTCHMQTIATGDPSFLQAGGHTFKVGWSNATNSVDLVAACQNCHGPQLTQFDFPLQDYNGDGVVEGVQTEVQHLLDKLASLLPPVGQAKSDIAIDSTWTRPQLEAAYNYRFVQKDGSRGIHNTAYAVGLLKASIANLTGVSASGGLPDAWVLQYFGSLTNPNAAPNATPAGDGVPNWLKYALGLDPMVPGVAVPGGVVWANGKDVVNPAGTNAITIYTAAEIAFNTDAGKTYQLQAISSLGGGWQNIGSPITGTGNSMSYVTPTRSNAQQFYRVVLGP